MKYSNFRSILLSSLVTTTLILYILNTKEDDKLNLRRSLISKSDYINLCNITNATSSVIINQEFSLILDTFSAFLVNFTFIDNDQTSNIRDSFINKDSSKRQTLIIELLSPYIILIIFGLITIIFWITYVICCFKPCCCLKGSEVESKCGWKLISMIIILLSLCGIIIVSIIGFVLSSKLPSKLDASECVLIKLYIDITDGETTNKIPKWSGISNIQNKFSQLQSSLDSIKQNHKNYKDISFLESDKATYSNLLTSSYNKIKDKTVTSPYPSGISNFIPGFIENYGPIDNSNSTIYTLSREFDNVIINSGNILNIIKLKANEISTNVELAKQIFQNVINNLETIKSNITILDSDYISKFSEFKKESIVKLNNTFIGLFAVIVGVSLLFILFTLLYGCLDIKLMKILSHIAWNIITLITIPLFIISGLFGLLATAFRYTGPLIQVLFEYDSLKTIFSDDMTVKILDTCMNKGGDLQTVLAGNLSMVDSLDNYVLYSNKIVASYNNMTSINVSYSINNIQSYYRLLDSDISLDSSTFVQSAKNTIKELNSYTDNSLQDSKQSSCSSNTYDTWVSDDVKCDNSYKLIFSSNRFNNIGSKSCLNLKTWDSETGKSRYINNPICPKGSISEIVGSFIKSLRVYASESSTVLASLQTEMTNLNSQYSTFKNKLLDPIKTSKSISDPLTNIISNEIGSGRLFDIISCGFVASDAAIIVDVFKQTGDSILQLCACLAALAFLNWFLLFFGLIFLFRKINTKTDSIKLE